MFSCLENEPLKFKSAFKPVGKETALKTPKTKGGARCITIPDYLINLLRHYKAEQLENRLKIGSE